MTAWLLALAAFSLPLGAQEPPEEDPSFQPRTYEFNPVKALNSLQAGDSYFGQGKYLPAKSRYTEATLYDPGSADAFRKLGEVDEKLRDFVGARAAYAKYFALQPAARDAAAIQKRIEKWPPPRRGSSPNQ